MPKPINSIEYKYGIPEPFEVKQIEGEDDFHIEGYASTKNLDRGGDIVEPEAFRETMKGFMENPIVCYMHRWGYDGAFPIGKVVEYRIDEIGLWVKIYISKTAATIRTLIKEEILKGLSIGYDLANGILEFPEGDRRRLIKLDMNEISVVTIPMNAETLAEMAKQKGINIKSLNIAPDEKDGADQKETIVPKEDVKNPETKDTKKDDAKEKSSELKALEEKVTGINDQLKSIDEKIANIKVGDPQLPEIIKQLVDSQKDSTSTFKEMLQKTQDDFFKRYDEQTLELNKKTATRRMNWDIPSVDMASLKGVKVRNAGEFHLKMINRRVVGLSESESKLWDEFLELHDKVYTASWFSKQYGDGSFDIKGMDIFHDFSRLQSEFLKAMDTDTATEGAEWIPVGYSPMLYDKILLPLRVAALFETIPMTIPTIKIPTDMVEETGYLIPQNLHDIGDKIRTMSPTTGEVELSAKKLGGRVVVSSEMIEDAIIALIPRVEKKIIRAVSRAIETSVINGDTTAAHQDSNVTNSWDARKAYNGLRKHTNASAKTDLATFNADTIRNMRKLMGECGIEPGDLYHVVSLSGYVNMLGLKDSSNNQVVTTIDKWGLQATFVTGTLGVFDGAGIIVSPFVWENLNATGVYDGVTTNKTIHIMVNKQGFVNGERRITKVAQKEDIETDQQITVVTHRRAFAKVLSDSSSPKAYPVAVGYNITP